MPKGNVPLPNTKIQETVSVNVLTKFNPKTLKGNTILHNVVPKEAEITNVRIIAGYGTSSDIKKVSFLVSKYGGNDYKWQKQGGVVQTGNFTYDLHWWQYGGVHYDYKIKEVRE